MSVNHGHAIACSIHTHTRTQTSRHIKLHYRCAFCSFVFIHIFIFRNALVYLSVSFFLSFRSLHLECRTMYVSVVCAGAQVVRLLGRILFFSLVLLCVRYYVYPFMEGRRCLYIFICDCNNIPTTQSNNSNNQKKKKYTKHQSGAEYILKGNFYGSYSLSVFILLCVIKRHSSAQVEYARQLVDCNSFLRSTLPAKPVELKARQFSRLTRTFIYFYFYFNIVSIGRYSLMHFYVFFFVSISFLHHK